MGLNLVSLQDPSQADRILGQAATRTAYAPAPDVSSPSDAMPVDSIGMSRSPHPLSLPPARSSHSNTPTVGTPIRLAPSTSAFRKPGQGSKPTTSTPGSQPATAPVVGTPGTPSKGVIGQFSDFVFGW
jgi:nuclear pore complex protein Nup53